MYHMGVELHLPHKLYRHFAARAAEVVARQVDEHYVLGVLFGVGQQRACKFMVAGVVAGAPECAGYRIDVGFAFLYTQVGLGRGAEHPEASHVEEE